MTTSLLSLLLLFALAIVQLPHLVHSAAHGGGPHAADRGCGVGAQRVPRSEVLKGVSCCFTEAPADQPRQLVITAHGGFSRKKEVVRRGAKLKRTWKEVAAPAVFKFYTTEGQYTYGNAVADLVLRAQANSHDPAHIDDALKALLPRTSDLVHEIRGPGQPPLSNAVFAATFSVVRRRVFDLFRARSDAIGGRSLIETVKRGDKMLDYDLSPLYHLSDEKRVDEAGRHNNEQAATVNFQRHGVVDVCFLDKDSSLKKVLKAATALLTKHHPGASYAVMHAAFCRFQDGPPAHHADAAKYVKAEVPPMAAEIEVSAAALNAMRQIYHEMTLEQFQAAAQAAFVTLNLEPIAFNEE